MKAASLAVIVMATLSLHGTANSQTFRPAKFTYGDNEIQKLDREYCMNELGDPLFKMPSSIAVVGKYFPNSGMKKYMFVTDAVWGRIVFGEQDAYSNDFGSCGMRREQFRDPTSIEIDPFLYAYVADNENCRVHVLRLNASVVPGVLETREIVAYAAAEETLAFPIDVACDDAGTPTYLYDDCLWVLSDYRNRIHKYKIINEPFHLSHVYSYGSYAGGAGGFNSPAAIVRGRSNEELTTWGSYNNNMVYVADSGNARIVQLQERPDSSGLEWVRSVQPVDPALRPNYASIEVDCWGNVYVVDMNNCQIVKLTSDLECLTSYGTMGTGTMEGEFMYPRDFEIFFYKTEESNPPEYPYGKWIGTHKAVVVESWGDETGFQGLFLGAEVLEESFALDEDGGTVTFDGILTDHCLLTATIERVVGQDIREIVRTIFADSTSVSGSLSVQWDGEDDGGSRVPCGDYYLVFRPVSLYDLSTEFDTTEIPFEITATGAGVVSSWMSTAWEETSAAGYYCPSGDGAVVELGIALKDCLGDPVVGVPAGDIVAVAASDSVGSAIAARGTDNCALSASNSQGIASIRIPHIGGCGELTFDVYAQGVLVGQQTIEVRSVDLNGDCVVDAGDESLFIDYMMHNNPCADFDGGGIGQSDIDIFYEHYFADGSEYHFSVHPGYSSANVTPSDPGCMVLCPGGDMESLSTLVTARSARNAGFPHSNIPADSIWAEIWEPEEGAPAEWQRFRFVCRPDCTTAVADSSTWGPEETTITIDSGGGHLEQVIQSGLDWDMEILIGGQKISEWEGLLKSPDIDASGVVHGTDVSLWFYDWDRCTFPGFPPECHFRSDFNCDGTVGNEDFDVMNHHYKHRCGSPSQMVAEGGSRPSSWTAEDAEKIRSHAPNYLLDELLAKELHPELEALLSLVRSMPEPDRLAALGGEVESARASLLPKVTSISQNVPNPLTGTSVISYQVAPPGGHVRIVIFDAAGRLVRTLVDENVPPGFYGVSWDGRGDSGREAPGGVYFYQMKAPGFKSNKRLILMR